MKVFFSTLVYVSCFMHLIAAFRYGKKHEILWKTVSEIKSTLFLYVLKISPQLNSVLSETVYVYRLLGEWEYKFSLYSVKFLS